MASEMARQAEGEERAAIVAMLRRAVCESVAGNSKPKFICQTPAKASFVLAFAFSILAEAVEKGEHLQAAAILSQKEPQG